MRVPSSTTAAAAVLASLLLGSGLASNWGGDGLWGRQGSGMRQPCQDRDAGQYCIGWNGILSCPDSNVTLCPTGQWCSSQLLPGQWNVYNTCADPTTVQSSVQNALVSVQQQWVATSSSSTSTSTSSTSGGAATGQGGALASGGGQTGQGSGLIGNDATQTTATDGSAPTGTLSCPSYAPLNGSTCGCPNHGTWNGTGCTCPTYSTWNGTTCHHANHAAYSKTMNAYVCTSKYAYGPSHTYCHHKPSTCRVNGTLGNTASPCSDPTVASAYYNASSWSYFTQPSCLNGALTKASTCYLKSCNATMTPNATTSCASLPDPPTCNATYQTIPIPAAVAPTNMTMSIFRHCIWNSTTSGCVTSSACYQVS